MLAVVTEIRIRKPLPPKSALCNATTAAPEPTLTALKPKKTPKPPARHVRPRTAGMTLPTLIIGTTGIETSRMNVMPRTSHVAEGMAPTVTIREGAVMDVLMTMWIPSKGD